MGRPKTPTNILELRGAFKNHPNRKRPGEPKPGTGIGAPPKYLQPNQRAVWKELVKAAAPGVFTGSDRAALEMASCLLAEMREDFSAFPTMKLTRLESLLARFGMTPADRSRVIVPNNERTNPFDDL